jgi:hypothetical protein
MLRRQHQLPLEKLMKMNMGSQIANESKYKNLNRMGSAWNPMRYAVEAKKQDMKRQQMFSMLVMCSNGHAAVEAENIVVYRSYK